MSSKSFFAGVAVAAVGITLGALVTAYFVGAEEEAAAEATGPVGETPVTPGPEAGATGE